jgi:uncharacterized protein DUF1579
MSKILYRAAMAVAVVAMLAVGSAPAARRAGQEAAQAPKLSEGMERLRFYLGEWDYTETYVKNSMHASGGKNTGLYTSKAGPGGNSVVQTFHSQGPVGDFEGLLVITWDPHEKAYKEYLFASDFQRCYVATGQFEGDELVFRGTVSMGGTMSMTMRNTTKLVAPGKISSATYASVNGAPEELMVTVDAVKR